MKKILLVLFVLIIAFVSCKKSNDPEHPNKDRLISILLGKDTLNMYVGETRQVPLTINPSDYHLDSLKWKSSDTTVLSFSPTGLLKAIKIGSSTITVSNLTNTISISALVTVVSAPVDSLAIGLIAYFPFNGNAIDSSSNANNGTTYNVNATADRFGNANGAYYFKGDSSSYITVKDNVALRLANTDFSINVWIDMLSYPTNLGSHIMSKRTPGGNSGYAYSINGSAATTLPLGSVRFGAGGDAPGANSTTGFGISNWHMLTLVYSLAKSEATYYFDGAFVNSVNSIPSPDETTTALLFIGKDNPAFFTDYYLNASLDELRIYGVQLSTHEIGILYTKK